MRVAFVSNYINHHQIPFCEAMRTRLGDDFVFVQTEEMDTERRKMGWKEEDLPYVLKLWERKEEAEKAVLECDVLLAGWAPKAEDLITRCLHEKRLTFRISERIYKDGQWKAVSPRGLVSKYRQYTRYAGNPYYLLSAGAYVGSDFSLIHAFPGKKLRWGYFPPLYTYAEGELQKIKKGASEGGVTQMVWAGRFVDFKHPEILPKLLSDLSAGGKKYHLTLAGGGDKETEFKEEIQKRGVSQNVTMLGLTSPESARKAMERSEIMIFTSDHGEGWGAVVNEAMNSGCAVVAGTEAGAVPFLLKNGENGLLYENRRYEDLVKSVELLLDDAALRKKLGKKAEETILSTWNAGTAAERLLALCEGLLMGGDLSQYVAEDDGPVSVDPCLRPYLKV